MSQRCDPGDVFCHYKGKEYRVICFAKHSETLEEFVVYEALYGEGQIWIRPKEMFFEKVKIDGVATPRFVRKAE